MTTVKAPAAEGRRGLLGRAHDTLAKPDAKAQTVLSRNGLTEHRIHFRFIQNTLWGLVIGSLVASCIVAGWYYGFLQMHWYLPIGPQWLRHGVSLKAWWDGGMGIVHNGAHNSWVLYRHNERNMGEATLAGLFAHTLLAGSKYWEMKLRTWQLIVLTPLLLVLAAILIAGGTWLEFFGMPDAWAHLASAAGRPGYNLDGAFSWAGKASLVNILLGVAVSFLVKRLWAPIGATLQGYLLDGSVARSGNRVPAWVWAPLAPPVDRERYTMMRRTGTVAVAVRESAAVTRIRHILITGIVVFGLLSLVLGALARYPIAHGTHIPYLNP